MLNFILLITGSPYRLDPDLMLAMAENAGVTDMITVREVYRDIKEGCDMKVGISNLVGSLLLGCQLYGTVSTVYCILYTAQVDAGKCRPTRSSNAPSARKHGDRVSDALAKWVKDRIVCGPFDTAPDNAIVNGIMTKGIKAPTRIIIIRINRLFATFFELDDCLLR